MAKRIYLWVLLVLAGYGCNDNLDIEQSSFISPESALQNPQSVEQLVRHAYDRARFLFFGNYQTFGEALANEGELEFLDQSEWFQSDNKLLNAFSGEVELAWEDSYNAINHLNIAVANVDLITDVEERDRVLGEALFLRGLIYFELARFFSFPYQPGGANDQISSVPLVLTPQLTLDKVLFPARASLSDVYAQILEDLERSATLLPSSNPANGYENPDSYAARALLARVHLQTGNFAAARDAADAVILNSGHGLCTSYGGCFNQVFGSVEDVLYWPVSEQDEPSVYFQNWYINGEFGEFGFSGIAIDSSFFEIFPENTADERAGFFDAFAVDESDLLFTRKWSTPFSFVPMIRLAEMHLIRAECNWRMGTSLGQPPLSDINLLRTRSGAEPFAVLTLDDILEERKRELAFEGFSLHDAKRLQRDIAGIPYDSHRLVYPIPQGELDVNPNLEQTPGY